jgi:thioester reductase-like protein
MTQPPVDLSHLSPAEKRALLAKLLQHEARAASPSSSSGEQRSTEPRQFAAAVAELDAEVALDPAISPSGLPAAPQKHARILLTGATGFLGAFVLHELLRRTGATIYCLVRCADVEEGRRRVDRSLAAYGLGSGHEASRVVPVAGDLSEPLLGLSPEQFDALAMQVDTIYHNGAAVNWIYSYSLLKPANVTGTQEILRLASRGTVKPVHLVSSLSVFPLVGNPQGKVVRETDSLDHGGVLYGGYTQSKWVAEKLATVARSRGIPVAVYRPGIITGDSRTGAWNTDDFLSRFLESWIELGRAPDLDGAIDMTPVDYVSSALVSLSLSEQALGKVFHLVNPRQVHLRELAAWIRSSGYPIEHVSYDQWRADLLGGAGGPNGRGLHSLTPLFSATAGGSARGQDRLGQEGQETVDRIGSLMAAQYAAMSVKFDDQQTRDGLAGTSISCPQVAGDVFSRYLSFFVRTGFVPAPVHPGKRQLVGQG